MSVNKGLFTSASQHWSTPKELYDSLNAEFHFNDDPCPLHGEGGLDREWGSRTYCNPPYGREITKWLLKAYAESLGETLRRQPKRSTKRSNWYLYKEKYAKKE